MFVGGHPQSTRAVEMRMSVNLRAVFAAAGVLPSGPSVRQQLVKVRNSRQAFFVLIFIYDWEWAFDPLDHALIED
jgi:hypothetical protein